MAADRKRILNLAQLIAATKTKGYDGYALIISTSLRHRNTEQRDFKVDCTMSEGISRSDNNQDKPEAGSARNLQGVLTDADKLQKYLINHSFRDQETGRHYNCLLYTSDAADE